LGWIMVLVNKDGYLIRKHRLGAKGHIGAATEPRDWWTIKNYPSGGRVDLTGINFPPEMIGKRIRLKVEVINPPILKCKCGGFIKVMELDEKRAICEHCKAVYDIREVSK